MGRAFPVTRFIGRALLFLSRCAAFVLSFALLALPFSRDGYQEVSDGIYGSGAPLMDSMLLDFLIRPWVTVLLGLMMLCYVYARFYLIPSTMRSISDLAYLAATYALMMGFQLALYLPVVTAPAL